MKSYLRINKNNTFALMVLFLIPMNSIAADSNDKNLKMTLESGLGYDNNIYRAPDEAYLDYGKTCNPATDGPDCIPGDDGKNHPYTRPEQNSSTFIPIRFQIKHLKTLNDKNTLTTEYHFKSSTYTDSKYSNADQFSHQINIGNKAVLNKKPKQKNNLYSGLFIGHKKRLYVDRDTGENQQSGPSDISDRYTYDFYGVEMIYDNKNGDMEFTGKLDYISRDYKSTEANVSEYDNIQIGVAGDVKWRIAKPTKLRAGLEIYTLDYDQRPARNELGQLFKSNPNRKYTYTILSAGIRHRFNKTWLMYFDIENKQRTDAYKGYDDYTKLQFKTRIHYRVTRKDKLKLAVSIWDRDYPNAYAFNNFIHNVSKSYSGNTIKLTNIYQISRTLLLDVSYHQKTQDTTDLRYKYDRSLFSATIEWNF